MFKQKIIDKYSKNLDETKLKAAYENFKSYQAKAEAIKSFKEEEYQDGFLRDVFEACLGYTLKTTNPNDYNLSRERKNETDGKKADGAVSIDSEVVALIELKDQNTKNLDVAKKGELSPVDQCFRYLNSHQKAKYAIVSNFDELRLYVGKKTEYEKFNLFSLDYDDFKRLYLTLSFESIKSGLTAKLKEETDSFEKQISKELYRDYSLFRSGLFEDIRKNNKHIEPHKLLRLTQTLCDRIIFILFAEDRELLRKNTIKEIRERYHNDIVGLSMYEYYKIYFKAINEGNEKLGIMPYNGGLFSENAELDSLVISDERLDLQAQKLSDYDFESDISVNILGHIFEQSLTDLEELSASLCGENIDKSKSKRKKDGVFYTPEYITRYIVANTLGKLCEQKREELGISSRIEPPKNPKKLTKTEEAAKSALQEYREWLKTLKICDPACGSGAFLNQALEYLIAEHKTTAQQIIYFGDLTATEDIEKSILEHNLYGVDINEEAVEIARLSLWLRTASKGRKLTNLSDKIKCGNSLIADKSVAENAFDWQAEFAEVFPKVMIDTNIIGNFTDEGNANKTDTSIENSKKLYQYAKEQKVKLVYSTMGEFEINKISDMDKKKIQSALIEPLPKEHGVFMWGSGGGWGKDVWATDEQIELFDKVKNIISENRSDATNFIEDAGMLISAQMNNVKYFITNNDKDFIKGERREELEKLTGIKIFTSQEFVEYFNGGKYKYGFDVIIGNPPYGAQLSEEHKKYFYARFKTVEYQINTYTLFMEMLSFLTVPKGKVGYIIPATWLAQNYFKNLRHHLIENFAFDNLILFRYEVFENTTIGETSTFLAEHSIPHNEQDIGFGVVNEVSEFDSLSFTSVKQSEWAQNYDKGFNLAFDTEQTTIIRQMEKGAIRLEEIADIVNGIKPYETGKGMPSQTAEDVKNRIYDADHKIDDSYRQYIVGGNIQKFTVTPDATKWIKFGSNLAAPRNFDFSKNKIVVRQTSDVIICAIDYNGFLNFNNVHNVILKSQDSISHETLAVILNSSLMDVYYTYLVPEKGRTFAEVKGVNLRKLPIKIPASEQNQILTELYHQISALKKQLNTLNIEFKSYLNTVLNVIKIPSKLDAPQNMSFDELKTVLEKSKVDIKDISVFRSVKQMHDEMVGLQGEVGRVNSEIDKVIGGLYGFGTEENTGSATKWHR